MTTDIRFQSKQRESFVKVDQHFILQNISPDASPDSLRNGSVCTLFSPVPIELTENYFFINV